MADVVFDLPVDVDNVLEEMGLDRKGLVDVVRYAAGEKALCTDNDAVGFANYLVYDKAARRIREIYCSRGWVKDDTNNQAAIKNPKTRIRVVPCNFDEDAGKIDGKPSNRSPKGEVSRKKTLCNKTAWLPGLEPPEPVPGDDGYLTWILGLYIEEEKPIGAELSFPTGFDVNYFTHLPKRILLMFGDDGDPATVKKPDVDDTFGEVDIEIKRK